MKLFCIILQLNLLTVCQKAKLPAYFQSNCVQSLFSILQQGTSIPLTVKDKTQIYIAYDNIDYLFKTNSVKLKGVVYCLTSQNYATEISATQLQAGDVVQYWNGKYGHCGIFHSFRNSKMYLWSSYPGTNWALTEFSIPQTLYACRIHQKYIK